MNKTIKSWYKSKTFWFNLASLALVILAMPEFISVLPEWCIKYVALGTAIGNKVLYRVTEAAKWVS